MSDGQVWTVPLPDGEPGPPGPQGPPGPPSTSVFFYRVDAMNQALQDPGGGKMRYDNPVQ